MAAIRADGMKSNHHRSGCWFSKTPQMRAVIQWYERPLRMSFSRSSTGRIGLEWEASEACWMGDAMSR